MRNNFSSVFVPTDVLMLSNCDQMFLCLNLMVKTCQMSTLGWCWVTVSGENEVDESSLLVGTPEY